MPPNPRDRFSHAITAWEGMYQGDPTDVANIIKLANGSIYTERNVNLRIAAAKKPGSVVIGTMRGITPRTWAAYKRVPIESLTAAQMKAISHTDAVNVYEAFYYKGPGFDRLKWCAATEVLCEIGWGSGPVTAIKAIQRLIGEHPDGVIGPRTIHMYDTWLQFRTPEEAVNAITDWRSNLYRGIVAREPTQKKFLAGWLRRSEYYRPTNAIWWAGWRGGDEVTVPTVPPIEQPIAPPRPTPPTVEDDIRKEADLQGTVQKATIVGGLFTSALAGLREVFPFLKFVPDWAIGVAIVAIVGVGSVWALKSLGVIKRSTN